MTVGCTSVILVLALTSLLTCDDKNSRVFAEEAGTAVSVSYCMVLRRVLRSDVEGILLVQGLYNNY